MRSIFSVINKSNYDDNDDNNCGDYDNNGSSNDNDLIIFIRLLLIKVHMIMM